jgi:hypothetical protein
MHYILALLVMCLISTFASTCENEQNFDWCGIKTKEYLYITLHAFDFCAKRADINTGLAKVVSNLKFNGVNAMLSHQNRELAASWLSALQEIHRDKKPTFKEGKLFLKEKLNGIGLVFFTKLCEQRSTEDEIIEETTELMRLNAEINPKECSQYFAATLILCSYLCQ